MKKNQLVLLTLFFVGCEGEIRINEKKLDTAGAKLQKTVKKGVDSVGVKLRRLKDSLEKDDGSERDK